MEEKYPTPNSIEFRQREFDRIRWTKPEYRNFFTIIKILAERGSSTINEILDSDGRSQQFKNRQSRYISYRRIIVGDAKTQVRGLIEKDVVVEGKAGNKLEKRYELSLYGVFYAIKLFMDHDIIMSGNYKNILKMDSKVRWYDYSKQTEFPATIMDVVAKNYSHLVPLVFGKWEYLKKNPRIDVYLLFGLANLHYNSNILMNDAIASNCKYSIDFTRFDGSIALAFYTRQIEGAYYPIEHFLKAMDGEIKEFIEKIFYSYERMHRENFHYSQGHYLLYKGQKGKALRHFINAIDCNDFFDFQQKEKFKKMSPDELLYHGISFRK
ncbi:hypothetical protein YTPLAS73_14560 [Nitrosarchaeum sp.]|nr:hypothetical protein YTPLAS73_14560 [Nitrosarchaeum sp.]